MDHVPQSYDSPHSPVEIPYLLQSIDNATKGLWSTLYDDATTLQEIPLDASLENLGLTQYRATSKDPNENGEGLENHDYDQKLIETGDQEGLDLNGWHKVLPFLQFNCYFNLLKSVFAVPGIGFKENDFIKKYDEKTVITTAPLPGYLVAWENGESDIPAFERAKKHKIIDRYLSRACEYITPHGQALVEIFQTLRTGGELSGDLATFELAKKVHLSIIILVETIWHASKVIYKMDEKPHQGLSTPSNPLNLERFLEAKWCPKDYQMAVDDVFGGNSTVEFMLSSIGRQNDTRDHSSCSFKGCRHDQVASAEYKTRHIEKWNCCTDVVLEDSKTSGPVIQLIKEGLTPILKVRQRRSDGLPMVSVIASHTEKTGSTTSIGNPPNHIVSYVAFSHVWSQGLGNPVQNALPKCQLVRLQALANQFAPPMYHPVAFWIDTLCVPLQKEYRKLAITAMRRVYTEARYVLVLDTSLLGLSKSLPPVELNMRISVSPWTQRLWTYQESSLAQNLLFQFKDGFIDTETIFKRYLEDLPQRVGSVHDNFNHLAAKRMVDMVWVESFQAIIRLSFASSYDDRAGEHNKISFLNMALAVRSTAKQEDEAICIACILGKEVNDLVSLPGKQRMKSLWLSVKFVPPGILFCNRPRYKEKGCRWMPKSLLRLPTAITPYTEMKSAEITAEGLRVAYPGIKWMLSSKVQSPLKLREICAEANGVMYEFRAPAYDPDKQVEQTDIHPGRSYGVIWPDIYPGKLEPGQDQRSFKRSEILPAALVMVEKCGDDGVEFCSFLTNMEVHRLMAGFHLLGDKSSSPEPNAKAEKVAVEHIWCVG